MTGNPKTKLIWFAGLFIAIVLAIFILAQTRGSESETDENLTPTPEVKSETTPTSRETFDEMEEELSPTTILTSTPTNMPTPTPTTKPSPTEGIGGFQTKPSNTPTPTKGLNFVNPE